MRQVPMTPITTPDILATVRTDPRFHLTAVMETTDFFQVAVRTPIKAPTSVDPAMPVTGTTDMDRVVMETDSEASTDTQLKDTDIIGNAMDTVDTDFPAMNTVGRLRSLSHSAAVIERSDRFGETAPRFARSITSSLCRSAAR